jgi:hypothetical protein
LTLLMYLEQAAWWEAKTASNPPWRI